MHDITHSPQEVQVEVGSVAAVINLSPYLSVRSQHLATKYIVSALILSPVSILLHIADNHLVDKTDKNIIYVTLRPAK